MPEPQKLRVRARRNQHGAILEWHPDDEEMAKQALENPSFVVRDLYTAVDRRHVADRTTVATVVVWPRSGDVIELDVVDEVARSEDSVERVQMQVSAEVAR